jgi:integration host factor subunit alpha
MACTKTDITKALGEQAGFTLKRSAAIIESLLGIIKRTLESGEDVLITGFGKFSVQKKRERQGRNPATGEGMRLRARRVITFKSSGSLRRKLNSK